MGCMQANSVIQQNSNMRQDIHFGITDFVHQVEGSIYNEYRFIEPSLGRGSFGEVFQVLHLKTGLQRAVKTVCKSKIKAHQKPFLQSQVQNLKRLDHPNILKVYEFYEDQEYFYMVTELCTGGELFNKIVTNKAFSEHSAAVIMRQILEAIQYCHKNAIAHRDLKPQNILFESNLSDSPIKIIDFGTSKHYNYDQMLNQRIGTPYYVAPEVLSGEYNQKCDIWSCGVILYLLLTGTPPFSEKKKKVLNLDLPIFREITPQGKELLSKMLVKDKDKRLSAEQCLKHKWFSMFTVEKRASNTTISKALTNLLSFRTESKLQMATWMYLVCVLSTKEQKKELLTIFKAIDSDKDNLIRQSELAESMKVVLSEDQSIRKSKIFFETIQKQTISFSQFIVYAINRKSILVESNLEKVFKMFDKDASQTITVSELKQILGSSKQLDLRIWEVLMKEADSNNDGCISLAQFKQMMKSVE